MLIKVKSGSTITERQRVSNTLIGREPDFWSHIQCFNGGKSCYYMDRVDIEPYLHYIDAFLEALDRAEEPEEEWP